jgi:hypothetical protein
MMMVSAVEMMMMMITMKSSSMTVTMATISPSGREFPPADFFLPESFSLSGVFRLVEAAEYLDAPPRVLGFRGGQVREGGAPVVGQGGQPTWRRGPRGNRAAWWAGPLLAHLSLPFWPPPSVK